MVVDRSCRSTSCHVGGFTPLAVRGHRRHLQRRRRAGAASPAASSATASGATRRSPTAGYGLSAVCKLLLAAVGTRAVGHRRDGRPARPHRQGHPDGPARRDDLAVHAERQLGAAFGVHRALDTTGAMIGPLWPSACWPLAPLAYDSVFLVSFFVALIGLGVLVAARPRARAARDAAARRRSRVPLRRARPARCSACRAPRAPGRRRRARPRHGERRLRLPGPAGQARPRQRRSSRCSSWAARPPTWCSRCRSGSLADRFGRGRVFLGGYALLLARLRAAAVPGAGRVVARRRRSACSAPTTPRPTAS